MYWRLRDSIFTSLASALLALVLIFATFLVFEPSVGRAQATSPFKVTQTVTDEISFIVNAANVIMSPNLAGLTGGNAAGTTSVRVRTNNATGYVMTIAFSSSTAMTRNSGGGTIRNYNPTTANIPDLAFSNEVFGQFAYTVIASTSADLNLSFRDSGAACNTGALNTVSTCWLNPSTTAKTVINTTVPTLSSGSTSTVAFRVNIPLNPVPLIPEGVYVATATLTASLN